MKNGISGKKPMMEGGISSRTYELPKSKLKQPQSDMDKKKKKWCADMAGKKVRC